MNLPIRKTASAAARRLLLACGVVALVLASPRPELAAGDKPAPVPGTQDLQAAGWKLPIMPYPRIAWMQYERGTGKIELFTDGTGKVVKAAMIKKIGYQSLDGGLVNWALEVWKGPPNAHATVSVTFTMR